MRKLIVVVVIVALCVAVIRRFGPASGERAMSKCHEMFERVPEEEASMAARGRGDDR